MLLMSWEEEENPCLCVQVVVRTKDCHLIRRQNYFATLLLRWSFGRMKSLCEALTLEAAPPVLESSSAEIQERQREKRNLF